MNLYKYDTHVHTSETSPCGNIGARELVHHYCGNGYHGIVITDHYFDGFFEGLGKTNWNDRIERYLTGYRIALEEGEKTGLNVILGMELRFKESWNDYLVYGFDEAFLKEYKELYSLDLKQFRELTKNKGILIYQAHPFRAYITPADPKLLDGAEVYNGNARHNSHDKKAFEFADRNKLKMLSGSDYHEHEDMGRGGILISEPVTTSRDFARILVENKVIELIRAV